MAVNIPSLNVNAIGEGLKDQNNYEAILDILQRYRKELNFYLMNLDLDNMPAVAENIDWINQSIDGVVISVGNNTGDIAALVVTAQGIQTQVTDLKTDTESSINQLSDSIELKVTSGDVKNMLNVNTSGVQITASNIDLNGITAVNKTLRLGSSTVDRGEIIFANNTSIRAVTGDYGYDLEISGAWTRFRSMISLGSNNHVSFGVGTTLDFYGTQLLNFPDTGEGSDGDEIRAYYSSNRFWADFNGSNRITIRGLDGLVKGYINLSSS